MSCDLFEFYKNIDPNKLNEVSFQDDPKCYYFDPYNIVGRINVYSPTLFKADPKRNSQKNNYGSKLVTKCVTIPNTGQTICTTQLPCPIPCDQEQGPKCLKPQSCNSNEQLLFSTYESSDGGAHKVCQVGGDECYCKSYSVTQNVISWCDLLKFNDDSSSVPFRCKDNKCIFNYSKNLKNKCQKSPAYNKQCISVPTQSGEPNISSSFISENPNYGYMTFEVFQNSSPTTNSDLSTLNQWRETLVTWQTNRVPKVLPITFTYPLYIMSQVLSIVKLFYYQLFNRFQKNDLNSYPYIGGTLLQDVYFPALITSGMGINKDIKFGEELNSLNFYQTNFLFFPVVKQVENNFQIKLTFSFDIYNKLNTDPNRLNSISSLMSILIDDGFNENVILVNTDTNQRINIIPAVYDDLIWDSGKMTCSYFDFTGFDTNTTSLYGYIKTTDLKNFQDNVIKTPNVFLVTISTTMNIKKWSPMLYIYSKINYNIPNDMNKNIAQKIHTDTGLYPYYLNFEKDFCDSDYYNCYMKYCSYKFIPSVARCSNPYKFAELFVPESSSCKCINTNITPVNVSPKYGNKESMCYTNTCSQDQLNKMGITTEFCKNSCSDINNWINNSAGPYTIQNLGQFNKDKYNNFCKAVPKIFFNLYYFFGIFITLICISLFINKRYQDRKNKIIFLTFFNTIGLIVSLFIGFVFAGESKCSEKENLCYSNLLKERIIPNSCCKYQVQDCECQFNEDCNDPSFSCKSGICKPYIQTDYTEIIKNKIPVLDILIFLINIIVVLTTIVYFVKIKKLEKTMLLIGIIGLYGVIFVLLYNLYWINVKVSYKKK